MMSTLFGSRAFRARVTPFVATLRAGTLAVALLAANSVHADVKPWFEFKNPVSTIREDPLLLGPDFRSAALSAPSSPVLIGFEGVSQYQTAALGRNFIPPDTMGAVGTTQFVQTLNGAFAVYDKATGAQLALTSDNAFWTARGGEATNGDPRVMFNAQYNRWVALAFGSDLKNIQIAVSDTDNALGPWKSTLFTGYDPANLFRPVADYPTLAMDRNAVYIGTNNFAGSTAAGVQTWRGTTLNVIPIDDLFGAAGPNAGNRKTFDSYYNTPGQTTSFAGFAIQGVNSNSLDTTGRIVTASAIDYGIQRYDITNAGTPGAARTAIKDIATGSYTGNCGGAICAARQPSGLRNIDALDDRISSSAYEANGRIYTVQTIMKPGQDFTSVRYYVLDANTNAVLDMGEIGGNGFDYFQGSLAVNAAGEVVIAYNRSGGADKGIDGRISLMARTYRTDANGKLHQVGAEILIKRSLTGAYLNGNTEASLTPAGRQRWGDYSQVTLDPLDDGTFWVVGEFAREANTPANGYPNGNGASRWGTYIAALSWDNNAGGEVPEPGSWGMLALGIGVLGFLRRRRASAL